MKSSAERLKGAFEKYGIVLEKKKVEDKIQKTFDNKVGQTDARLFSSYVLAELGEEFHGLRITDFEKFRQKVGLSEKWSNLPNWFVETCGIMMGGRNNRYFLSTREGKNFGGQPEGKKLSTEPYFLAKIKQEHRDEIKLREAFNPEIGDSMLRFLTLSAYKELEEEMADNLELLKLTKRVKSILADEYKVRYHIRVKTN